MNKKNNTSFVLDKDVEKYYRNIGIIKLYDEIENNSYWVGTITQKDYLNDLIRKDMKRFLAFNKVETIEDYFKEKHIKGVK